MHLRLDGKLAWLYLMLISQVLIVMIYVISTPKTDVINLTTQTTVSFVKFVNKEEHQVSSTYKPSPIFRTITSSIYLKDTKTSKLFHYYNQTLCYKNGVDDRRMQLQEFPSNRCICNPGWHGSDCGQPEVAWRAIMASKQYVKLKLRKVARRVIYAFCLNDYDSAVAEATVEELASVVDLFLICDFSTGENNFRHRLNKNLLRPHQSKILYISATKLETVSRGELLNFIWSKLKRALHNPRYDDVFAMTKSEQILNSKALMFLKLYDGWPQPIGFRLRWSVFGFFWQHPLRTSIVVGACTIGLVREHVSRKQSPFLQKQPETVRETLGLVVGDLNHYGGWYCQYCESPANIVSAIVARNITDTEKNIDVPYVEDLIGGGLLFDGKTNLLRVYRSHEAYFAPEIVLNETWKYDWLVENFYAKLDYY